MVFEWQIILDFPMKLTTIDGLGYKYNNIGIGNACIRSAL